MTRNDFMRSPLAGLFKRFASNRNGALSVETALILPIYITILAFGFEAAAYMKLRERHNSAVTAIGEIVSSAPGNVSCDMLNSMSDLTFEVYRTGNWGSLLAANATNSQRASEMPYYLAGYDVIVGSDMQKWGTKKWGFNRMAYDPGVDFLDYLGFPSQHQAGDQGLMIYTELNSYLPGQLYGLWGRNTLWNGMLKYFAPRYVNKISLNGPYVGTTCNVF